MIKADALVKRLFIFLGSVGLFLIGETFPAISASEEPPKVLPMAVSGYWYPAQKEALEGMIDGFFQEAKPVTVSGKILFAMAPHAGYIYSGPVAAYTYKAIKSQGPYDSIVVIGFSHFVPFDGISIYYQGDCQTPLGKLKVNSDLAKEIMAKDEVFSFSYNVYRKEHSVEAQLPFIKYIFPDAQVVPIVMGEQSRRNIEALGSALLEVAKGKNLLFLISSDMSHYHDYQEAKEMDERTLHLITSLNEEALYHEAIMGRCQLCGLGPVMAAMNMARQLGASEVQVLKYANSGDVFPDKRDNVVGYGAVVFTTPSKKPSAQLSQEERDYLLSLARGSIENYLDGKPFQYPDSPPWPSLMEKRGVFVTLKEGGQLRGCIGHIEPDLPLYQQVSRCALSSAVEDRRFLPLGMSELNGVMIEISILSPFRRVQGPEEIQLGEHGVLVKRNENSFLHQGIFLPQVATETGWSKKRFLEELCFSKASLPKDAYMMPGTELFVFTVEHFSEAP